MSAIIIIVYKPARHCYNCS